MSERTVYPKGLVATTTSNLNSPPANPALAARQLSAAESSMLSSRSSVAAARDSAALEPAPPSLISQIGSKAAGLAGNIGATVGGIAETIVGGAISDVTNSLSSLASGDIASGMSSIGNALSKFSGTGPTGVSDGAEVVSTNSTFTKVNPSTGTDWRVKISAPFDLLGGTLNNRLEDTNGLVFPYLPTVNISTSASYNTQGLTHNNYPFNAYQNSQVDDITITGEFSCETPEDAEYWLAATLFLRGATKMFFGESSNVGNPPVICKLSGYGSHVFNDVSCIVKNFTVNLPPDVDYILYEAAGAKPSAWDSRESRERMSSLLGEKTWVPILSEISVTVSPIYSREKMRKFNLQDYTSGNVGATKGFV